MEPTQSIQGAFERMHELNLYNANRLSDACIENAKLAEKITGLKKALYSSGNLPALRLHRKLIKWEIKRLER
mgnify:CR=1 FL=1